MLFFLAYLIMSGVTFSTSKFLQYYTNWGHVTFTLYLIWSALSVTIRYIHVHFCSKEIPKLKNYPKSSKPPVGCCGLIIDSTTWYQKIHWLLFIIGSEVAVSITILYWPLFYNPDYDYDYFGHINLVVHLFNGLLAYTDFWLTSVPIRLYHAVYLVAFGGIYSVFTGIHYAANSNRSEFIYPQIDYQANPGSASGFVVTIVLVFLPIVHVIFYVSYLGREGIFFLIKKFCCKQDIKKDDEIAMSTINPENI